MPRTKHLSYYTDHKQDGHFRGLVKGVSEACPSHSVGPVHPQTQAQTHPNLILRRTGIISFCFITRSGSQERWGWPRRRRTNSRAKHSPAPMRHGAVCPPEGPVYRGPGHQHLHVGGLSRKDAPWVPLTGRNQIHSWCLLLTRAWATSLWNQTGPRAPLFTSGESCKFRAREGYRRGDGRRQRPSRDPRQESFLARRRTLLRAHSHCSLSPQIQRAHPARSYTSRQFLRRVWPASPITASQTGRCCEAAVTTSI